MTPDVIACVVVGWFMLGAAALFFADDEEPLRVFVFWPLLFLKWFVKNLWAILTDWRMGERRNG